MSLPVRGAWIEMHENRVFSVVEESLPVRGAWIEMRFTLMRIKKRNSRSPCGERGLKSRRNCTS